jgi:adenylate kinase family enzyme
MYDPPMASSVPDLPSDPAVPPLGRKILVWGGGGKTALACALGEKLRLPVIELDAIFWLPEWVQREPQEFKAPVHEKIEELDDGWIVDGQYVGHLGSDVLAHAETLIWLKLPWRIIFWRVLRRSIYRVRDKKRICGDNVETLRQLFFKRDSLLYWYIGRKLGGGHRRSLANKEALVAEFGQHATIIRIATPSQLEDFYDGLGLVSPKVCL